MNGVGLRITSVALKLYPFTGGFRISIFVTLKAPFSFTNSVYPLKVPTKEWRVELYP